MIEKLEDRGDSAYIVEDGEARIITKDEYVSKLQELDNQNKTMENEEIITTEEVETTDVDETAPVSPETASESDVVEEVEETLVDEEVSQELADNAPASEDALVDDAPVE